MTRVEMDGTIEPGDSQKGGQKVPIQEPAIRRKSKAGASVAVTKFDVNYGVPSKKSVHDFLKFKKGDQSWQFNIHKFLEQRWVETTLVCLLMLDILIIFTELILMSEFPSCRLLKRDGEACCPYEGGVAGDDQQNRWLSESVCSAGYDATGVASCDEHKWEQVHTAEQFLFYTTITILSIFLIENLAEMAALGIINFFKQLFLALDFLVVTISLVFELVFHFQKNKFEQVVAVLVLFRVWRFVRIGHALFEVSSEITSREYECLFEYITKVEKELQAKHIELPEKSDDVQALIDDHLGHAHQHGEQSH